jgi:hypothetical protein
MTKTNRKTEFVTTAIFKATKAKLDAQAKREHLGIAAYINRLVELDSGFECIGEIRLPSRVLRHTESYEEGIATGVVAAAAMLIKEGLPGVALEMVRRSGIDPRAAIEWDLQVLRKVDPTIPRGRLVRRSE